MKGTSLWNEKFDWVKLRAGEWHLRILASTVQKRWMQFITRYLDVTLIHKKMGDWCRQNKSF